MKYILIVLAFASMYALSSCSKEDVSINATQTKKLAKTNSNLPTYCDRITALVNAGYIAVDTLPSKTYTLPVTLNADAQVKYFIDPIYGDWVIVIGENPNNPIADQGVFDKQLTISYPKDGTTRYRCFGTGVDCYNEIVLNEETKQLNVEIVKAPNC